MGYFGEIKEAAQTLSKGFKTTWKHLRESSERKAPMQAEHENYFQQSEGQVTIQYPKEQIPVPDVGRYRLYMETEDCIVCDQCVRVCPVDCITIEKVKAVDDLGTTSDGSKKRFYLPTFDIDMAKCCYCGLCTIVCPTECLVMTKVYDYSEYDRENFIYHFGNLSPEQTQEKEDELAAFEAEKKAAKQRAMAEAKAKESPAPEANVPPGVKPPGPPKGAAPPPGVKPPAPPKGTPPPPAGVKPPGPPKGAAPPPGVKPPGPPKGTPPPAGVKPPAPPKGTAPPPGVKPPDDKEEEA